MKQSTLAAMAFFLGGLAIGAVLIWFILPPAMTIRFSAQRSNPSSSPTPVHPDVVAALDRCQPKLADCNAYHDCVRREAGDAVANGLPDCPAAPAPPTPARAEYIVCFSPRVPADGCDPMTAAVRSIDAAKRTVELQTCTLTSQAAVDALVRAAARQVVVSMIVDRQMLEAQPELVLNLARAGLAIRVDATVRGAARDNVMLIDGTIALAGSFDFTGEAEHENADHLLITDDSAIVDRYIANWRFHLAHSEPIEMKVMPAPSSTSARHRVLRRPHRPHRRPAHEEDSGH
jgi:phosphatidylserine/phosphatidylglycerophosphate/cardiolipin synthase-like enzyme